MSEEKKELTAREDDCVMSLAAAHGFFWRTVWDDPDNSQLKTDRGDPAVLRPGDRVVIPAKTEREESCATESTHTFRKKGVPCKVRLQLVKNGEPRAGEPFQGMVDGISVEGQTDADGVLEFFASPTAHEAQLVVGSGDDARTLALKLGSLAPTEDPRGSNARLKNLGYLKTEQRDGEWTPASEIALRSFQEENDLEVTGEIDEATSQKLREVHGS